MKLSLLKGTTSKLLTVFIQDSTSTTGGGLTGLAFGTSGLAAYYLREGAGSATSITLATMTLGTWATGGFIVVDGTNMPGVYQLGIPDAAIASGAKSVVVMIRGAANMAPLVLEIELTAVDNQSATAFVTGINSLAPPTNWNLESIDGSGRVDVAKVSGTSQTARDLGASVLLSPGTGTGQISLSSGAVTAGTVSDKTGYTVSTVSDKTGYSLSSGGIQAIWDALTSALTTVGSIGKLLVTNIDAAISSRATAAGGGGSVDISSAGVQAIWDALTSALTTAGSIGKRLTDDIGAAPANWASMVIDGSGRVDVSKVSGTSQTARDLGASVLLSPGTGTGQISLSSGAVTAGTISDKTGYTVSTVSDKTGYSLTQTFPSNFSALSIDGSGRVDVAKLAGTAQTARDIGASVLLSSGTGTGQISLTSGAVTYAPGEMAVKKNTALSNFAFLMVSSVDHVTPKTGLGTGITATRSIDGAAFGSCTNTPTELASGIYLLDFSAGDLNGTVITVLLTGTGADARYITILTQA
jgi:hypothetical protein